MPLGSCCHLCGILILVCCFYSSPLIAALNIIALIRSPVSDSPTALLFMLLPTVLPLSVLLSPGIQSNKELSLLLIILVDRFFCFPFGRSLDLSYLPLKSRLYTIYSILLSFWLKQDLGKMICEWIIILIMCWAGQFILVNLSKLGISLGFDHGLFSLFESIVNICPCRQ